MTQTDTHDSDDNRFQPYRQVTIKELRPVTQDDIETWPGGYGISIGEADRAAGSPRIGDMIARNPANHRDQWLVAQAYFEQNFEPVK